MNATNEDRSSRPPNLIEDVQLARITAAQASPPSGFHIGRLPLAGLRHTHASISLCQKSMTGSKGLNEPLHMLAGKSSHDMERLSPREKEVLEKLAEGHLVKEIADQLGVGFGSVRTYVRRIYEKLQVRSRSQAAARYYQSLYII